METHRPDPIHPQAERRGLTGIPDAMVRVEKRHDTGRVRDRRKGWYRRSAQHRRDRAEPQTFRRCQERHARDFNDAGGPGRRLDCQGNGQPN